ncbi:MAG: hypothetical protein ACYS7M_15860, partial [Planctomycetota bacterium]
RGETLLAQAKELDLKAAWDADEELQEIVGNGGGGFTEPVPFSRDQLQSYTGYGFGPYVQGLGFVDREFVRRCFAIGASGDQNDRWAVIPLPEQTTVVVVDAACAARRLREGPPEAGLRPAERPTQAGGRRVAGPGADPIAQSLRLR